MSVKVVDARKELCPRPLIMTKKALTELKEGEKILVIVDNEIAKENVSRFLKDNNIQVEIVKKENDYHLHVGEKTENLIHPNAEEYCPVVKEKHHKGDHVVVISKNHMGDGPEELTNLLIQGFVNTIKEIKPFPKAIVFYTSGIFLTLEDSPVLSSLKYLEDHRVKILVCGTCLSFYEVKEKMAVGQISNMYTILETMTEASHIVGPY